MENNDENFAQQCDNDIPQQCENPQKADSAEGAFCATSDNSSPAVARGLQEETLPPKRSRIKAVDVFLWVLVAVLAVALVLRVFFFGKIVIEGSSMTTPYYLDQPELNFFEEDRVWVNKVSKPSRGDVVVFYKNDIDSKLKAAFASGDELGEGGKYQRLIKRVVALEGDSIWVEPVEGGKYRLVVLPKGADTPIAEDYYTKNGHLLDPEAFLMSTVDARYMDGLKDTSAQNPHVVKEGCFYAMGDNRDVSKDSRSDLGDVPFDRLYGVVL